MSLTDMYQTTKAEKKPCQEKVVYTAHANSIKGEIEALDMRVSMLCTDVKKLEESVKALESVNLAQYTEKHNRIKENYNSLVSSYNQSQVELKAVVLDISKRINEVEAKL
jgi:hypothetical protein